MTESCDPARGLTQPAPRPAACETPLLFDGTPPPAGYAPPARELVPGDVFGGYRVERQLGMGGMGSVYLATDTRLGRQVAVKTMRPDAAADPDARERFVREARAAAAIDHENVVPVYAVGEYEGTPYLVMPLLKGESLDARLRSGAWPTLAEVCRLGREVAEGLAAAHAVGLVHRDVKPANVWIGADGRAKLLDFGLARLARGGPALTRAGVMVGTPSYMAPEQAAGGAIDGRADLFSLGVMLYELTTRRKPFTGDSVLAVLTALAIHRPPPAHQTNPGVPAALSRLIDRLLAKAPAERPESAAEVCDALAAVDAAPTPPKGDLSVSTPPVADGGRTKALSGAAKWARRLGPVLAFLGGTLLVAYRLATR